jgi:hypothetical protein
MAIEYVYAVIGLVLIGIAILGILQDRKENVEGRIKSGQEMRELEAEAQELKRLTDQLREKYKGQFEAVARPIDALVKSHFEKLIAGDKKAALNHLKIAQNIARTLLNHK